MSRTTFKQADVVRAIKSAKAAGMKVETIEVITADGTTIRVVGKRPCQANPWDELLEQSDESGSKIRP
jgi:hypothetical protein